MFLLLLLRVNSLIFQLNQWYCQDFPAVHSDITAGQVGSKKGFTTVLAWTDKGKRIVESAIKEGLFEKGKVNENEISKHFVDLFRRRINIYRYF